jgi:hypothetical protein
VELWRLTGRTWLEPHLLSQALLGTRTKHALAERSEDASGASPLRATEWDVAEHPMGQALGGARQSGDAATRAVLEYLAVTCIATALTDKAIVACTDQHVIFTYRDSQNPSEKDEDARRSRVSAAFLQHVPPKGCTESAPLDCYIRVGAAH